MDRKDRYKRGYPKSRKSKIYGGSNGGSYTTIHGPFTPRKEIREIMEINKQESNTKREIFDIIFDYVYNNKSILELINKLNSNENFAKYTEYFGTWIEDAQNKKQKIIKEIKNYIKKGVEYDYIIETLSIKYRGSEKYLKILFEQVQNEENEVEPEID